MGLTTKSSKKYKLHLCYGNMVGLELPSGKNLLISEVKKGQNTELKISIQDTDWDSIEIKEKIHQNSIKLLLGYDFSSLDDLKEELKHGN